MTRGHPQAHSARVGTDSTDRRSQVIDFAIVIDIAKVIDIAIESDAQRSGLNAVL